MQVLKFLLADAMMELGDGQHDSMELLKIYVEL